MTSLQFTAVEAMATTAIKRTNILLVEFMEFKSKL